ncbi:MAG: indolepyruvate ferredoxin oxidoreductase family protein [Alphaproteobacteria bacterium]
MALAAVTLDDKYEREDGRVYLTGTQALVRLPMMQRRRDEAAGLNTACFVTGYRGSPLGGLDQQMWAAAAFLKRHHIVFRGGVNEDMAATAIWGTQQVGLFQGPKYDGVFAMWYGKGPGVDRSGDVFKHANLAGTSPHGGVLALAGDDHQAKSSTTAHQSDFAFLDANMPLLSPAGVQELIDFGLYGIAMSRFSGCWVGFKCVGDTMDSAASVSVDPHRVPIVLPEGVAMPPGGLNLRFPDPFLEQEKRLHQFKVPAAMAFARANGIDRVLYRPKNARLGIVTVGKSYLDVRQALDDLHIDEAEAERLGIALYKVGMIYPLEPVGLTEFAAGLDEVLVVEEKRALIETQAKEALYNLPDGRRPRLFGKRDEEGAWMLPSDGELTPARIARTIARRLKGLGIESESISRRMAWFDAKERALDSHPAPLARPPHYCSGCPHNTSTVVPEGSIQLAGIGCHYMVVLMDRNAITFSQMGGEGVAWTGASPFSETRHVFTNLGDGTYFHSGIMAIRAAVAAADVNITYKILYNDAVAMTGGQPVDGPLSVPQITRQVAAEGVNRIAVVSDEPDKYPRGTDFAPGVTIHHRDDLEAVQREMRESPGVTVIVYDQTCAAEKRRRRKRGTYPDPAKRVVINELVCEGCGDCSVKSNCLSVVPVDTEFGRKRAIDQSSCNKDYSCLRGFCPSFVTVEGGALRKPKTLQRADGADRWTIALPEPALPPTAEPYGIVVTGIGGTGVVTIGALIGMAAHIEGKGVSVMDMTGLAQKGGAVVSHIRIADRPEQLHAVRIAAGGADLLLGCDIVTSAAFDTLAKTTAGETRAVINDERTITGAFTRNPDFVFPDQGLRDAIADAVGPEATEFIAATRLATALLGNSIATNLFMLGYAWQKGTVPVGEAALMQAIELNKVAVDANKRAFLWGRRAAVDMAAVEALSRPAKAEPAAPATLDDLVARRVEFLTGYQNAAYAARYQALVDRAAQAEKAKAPGMTGFAEAVARYYFKLLAYKDEYEVGRLHSDRTFLARIQEQFEGDYKLKYHLAPPLLAKTDPVTGHPRKKTYGPWMLRAFRLLARLRRLRGTPFDVFGYSEERRTERRLIAEYEAVVAELIDRLSHDSHPLVVEIARLPEQIRGYGHVKERHRLAAKAKEADLLATLRNNAGRPLTQAAE